MSEIDSFQHECIGIVACPSDHEIVAGNTMHRGIPLYLLKEDAPTATSFQAKNGDLLLGGGSGESAALRISIPGAFSFFTSEHQADAEPADKPVKAYWNMNQAYVFCDGYAKAGWTPQERIEHWLAKRLLAFVLREYPDLFGNYQGSFLLEQDGSLCRVPTAEEKQMW